MFSTYIKGIYENHLYPWDRIHPGYLPHGTVCVGEDTRIRTQGLGIRIGDLVPKEVGEKDISNLGIRALTHTGSYQRVLIAVNKGYKAMWEIEDSLGNSLECMPEHLLMSEKGWKTVKDIVEQDLLIASFSPPYTQNKPQTVPPSLEVVLPIKGFDG